MLAILCQQVEERVVVLLAREAKLHLGLQIDLAAIVGQLAADIDAAEREQLQCLIDRVGILKTEVL